MSRKRKKHPILFITAVLGAMTAYNRSEYKKATAKNINDASDCRVYSGRFGDISYKRIGKGKPLLLIHDVTPSSNLYEWNFVMEKLAESYSVYAVDLLGCGNSDKHNMEYCAYMYALAVNDFVLNRICRGADNRPVTAIASCASASLLICAAALNGSLYEHIGLVNPKTMDMTYCNPSTNPFIVKCLRHIYNMPVLGSFLYNLTYTRANILAKFSGEEYSGLSDKEREQLADAMYEAAHIGGFNSRFLHSSIHGSLLEMDILRMLNKLTVDCFILAGENAKDCDKVIKALCKTKKDIHVAILEGVSTPHLENPEEFIKLLKNSLTVS